MSQAIDNDVADDIMDMAQCHLPPASITDEASFATAFGVKYFVGFCSDGTEVELVPGGRSVVVTLANRLKYCALLERMRLYVRELCLNRWPAPLLGSWR